MLINSFRYPRKINIYIYIYLCKNLSDLGSKTIRVHEERSGRVKERNKREKKRGGEKRETGKG